MPKVQQVSAQLVLDARYWRVLTKYCAVINKKLSKKGLDPVAPQRLISAIVVAFLQTQQDRILKEAGDITYDELLDSVKGLFNEHDLRLVGLRKDPEGAVQTVVGARPKTVVLRQPGEPRKVRPRSKRFAGAFSPWEPPNKRRATTTG